MYIVTIGIDSDTAVCNWWETGRLIGDIDQPGVTIICDDAISFLPLEKAVRT
jgi:hypothetical protein